MSVFLKDLPLDCIWEIINNLDIEAKNALIFVNIFFRSIIISKIQLPIYGYKLILFALMQHTIGVDFFHESVNSLQNIRKVRISDFIPLEVDDPITKWFISLNGGDTNRLIMMVNPEVMGLKAKKIELSHTLGAGIIKRSGKKKNIKKRKKSVPYELIFFAKQYIEYKELNKLQWMLAFGVQLRSELKIKMLLSHLRGYENWGNILQIYTGQYFTNYTHDDLEYIGRYLTWNDYRTLNLYTYIIWSKSDIIKSTARHYGNKSLLENFDEDFNW